MSGKTKKTAQRAAQSEKKNNKKAIIIAVCIIAVLLVAAVVAVALLAGKGEKEPSPAIGKIVSVTVPVPQDDGSIVQTNKGMFETPADTLREALDTTWSDYCTVTYNEDGSISGINGVGKAPGHFEISVFSTVDDVYKKGLNILSSKPGEIELCDGYSYEIAFIEDKE